ncbi:MAG TPA: type II toxin-antitoxin system VapB family antitoxin, partial [Longimicrobiales bacterium]|nr:type II toxin-antitoxin system VapB family antitoxin [Longimicrobiales bacterium]
MSEKTLNIKNPETARLARRLAAHEGTSITEAITNALRERLERLEKPASTAAARAGVGRIQAMVAALPERDERTSDEVLGYDEYG